VVEIAKALSRRVKIIVFDEPTAVLSAQDAERLHEIIGRLRAEGVGIVYISHRLEEILSISDRVTVMKDGQVVATRPAAELTIDGMIRMMVGRPMAALFPEKGPRTIGEERLAVRDLQAGRLVRGVTFSVRAGEIVGLGGLVGSGRTEVARVIFGADRFESGAIILDGREMKIRSPKDAVKAGVCLVPEDRKGQGVVLDAAIRINATMARLSAVVNRLGFIREAVERKLVNELAASLKLKASRIDAPVSTLSGGNQQKVVLGKCLNAGVKILLLDEPTRGVDIGAKAQIYQLINELAVGDPASGRKPCAILVVSSYLPELLGICDRIAVMSRGLLGASRPVNEWNAHTLMVEAVGQETQLTETRA